MILEIGVGVKSREKNGIFDSFSVVNLFRASVLVRVECTGACHLTRCLAKDQPKV